MMGQYTIHDVVSLTGISRSRQMAWRRLGILPSPTGGRKFARYDDAYLRAIQRVKDELLDANRTRAEFAEYLRYEATQSDGPD